MNKNLVIGLVVLLLLGGGGYYMMTKNSSSVQPSGTAPEQTANSTTTGKSLKDLLMSGVAQKCTFTDKMENVDMSGTTYVANGKMRGDFNSSANGKTTNSHMIVDGKTSYMWMNEDKTGFKFSFDPQSTDVKANEQQKGAVDVNKMIDYKCSPGGVDNSLFTPPTDVKFTDYSAMMGPTGSKTGTGVNLGCSACDSLTGDEKAQCLAALKCS